MCSVFELDNLVAGHKNRQGVMPVSANVIKFVDLDRCRI